MEVLPKVKIKIKTIFAVVVLGSAGLLAGCEGEEIPSGKLATTEAQSTDESQLLIEANVGATPNTSAALPAVSKSIDAEQQTQHSEEIAVSSPVEQVEKTVVDLLIEHTEETGEKSPVDRTEDNTVGRPVERVEEVDMPAERVEDNNVDLPIERVEENTVDLPVERVEENNVDLPVERVEENNVDLPVERVEENKVDQPEPEKKEIDVLPIARAEEDVEPEFNQIFSPEVEPRPEEQVQLTGCVGNLAWVDSNGNGVKETAEKGISIEKIDLLTLDGSIADSTSTKTGYYQLCGMPGDYVIRFELPTGYVVTTKDAGRSDTADSDANELAEIEAPIVLRRNKTKYDIGLVLAGSPPPPTVVDELIPTTPEIEQPTPEPQPKPPTIVAEPETIQPPLTVPGTNNDNIRWGFWVETRNAYQSNDGSADPDEGVQTVFENYSFSHVRGNSLNAVGGDLTDKQYVVNIINKAKQTGTVLDLQLGSASDYGWNYSTGRGNFNLTRWKDSLSRFGSSNDPVAHQTIVEAIANGTIRYIFLIDEPNHKRWSPGWNGKHGSAATGSSNHVSNQDLDEMAAHAKSLFGNQTQTIVRTSPVNLITGARGGMYVFQHMTHAYLTISSTKWTIGSNKGPNKGFEWFLTLKNNHADNTTNMSAYHATNLKPSIMIQAGFESAGNPWTGEKTFKSRWWQGDIRYPYKGKTGYVKTSPGEMDYWIKSLLSPRDEITGELSSTGTRWFNEFVIFRADRLPTDQGRLPFSSYPHYTSFLDQLRIDMQNNNLEPIVGVPVGWTGD